MALTREQILECVDLPREAVEVTEWGGTVWVTRLSGLHRAELDDITRNLLGEDKKFTSVTGLEYTLALLVRAVVDEDGNRLFTDDDIQRLRTKSDEALGRVAEVAVRLNGLGAKAEQEIKKNEPPNANSISSSPVPLAA